MEDLDPLVAEPLDLLVCEMSHFRAEDLFRYLNGRRIKHVVLVHLGRRCWEGFQKTRKLAKKMLPRLRLSFPRDQQVLPL